MTTGVLLRLVEASVEQCTLPQSVAAGMETIGLLVPIELIYDLGRVDFLIAARARLAAAQTKPYLRRPLARQLTVIDTASDLLDERYVATFHTPPDTHRLASPCPPRIAGTCTQSTEAQARVSSVRVGPCSSASALAPLRCWPYCWIFPRQRPGATAQCIERLANTGVNTADPITPRARNFVAASPRNFFFERDQFEAIRAQLPPELHGVREHLVGDLRQPRFRVAVRGGRVYSISPLPVAL